MTLDLLLIIAQVALLVALSGMYSGLNIALMSLSRADLERKKKLGNRDAAKVLPFRTNSHLSLASILFANVAVVSASALLLEHHTGGWIAGIVSTILIVIFGEVIPQAIFVKRALKFCAALAPVLWLTRLVMYPLAKPLQVLLDRLVGRESRVLHTRAELGLLISEHKIGDASELDADEVGIIQHALQMSEKSVGDIMRPINQVYWLHDDTILNQRIVDDITSRGFSRVPIFSHDLTTCHGVLLMKDMVDIDFDTSPVPVANFRLHQTRVIGSRTALDTMLREFGSLQSHLVPIEQHGKIVGIVTAEDLLEEIIGQEIADETDRVQRRV